MISMHTHHETDRTYIHTYTHTNTRIYKQQERCRAQRGEVLKFEIDYLRKRAGCWLDLIAQREVGLVGLGAMLFMLILTLTGRQKSS